MFKFRAEFIFYLSIMVLGLVIMNLSWKYGFGTFGTPGPGLYPFFIGLSIFACACWFLVLTLKPKSDFTSKPLFDRYGITQFLLMNANFILWIILMPFLGYAIDSFFVSLIFLKIMRLRGWVKPILLSAGTTLFIYLLFDYFLYTDMPRGILGK